MITSALPLCAAVAYVRKSVVQSFALQSHVTRSKVIMHLSVLQTLYCPMTIHILEDVQRHWPDSALPLTFKTNAVQVNVTLLTHHSHYSVKCKPPVSTCDQEQP